MKENKRTSMGCISGGSSCNKTKENESTEENENTEEESE